jgi:hypothetical protein
LTICRRDRGGRLRAHLYLSVFFLQNEFSRGETTEAA